MASPALSVTHYVCEGESDQSDCDFHHDKTGSMLPQPPSTTGKAERGGVERDVDTIPRLRVDLNMETLERAVLSRWVGNCVV